MDYVRHYDRLIARAVGRELTGYSERHHILPKCKGGSNSPKNLVRLTPEEHYVAHQLLVKMYPDDERLAWAAMNMTGKARTHQRRNKLYGWLRRRVAEGVSSRLRGVPKSASHRAALSQVKFGNTNARGHKVSPEARVKMGLGSGRQLSELLAQRTLMGMSATQRKRVVAWRLDHGLTPSPSRLGSLRMSTTIGG